jgi:hypothetical protein
MARMTGERLQALRTRYPEVPTVFVETGTFEGKTTRLALEQFAAVHTVELDHDRFWRALSQLGPLGTHCYHGDSRVWVPRLAKQIEGPVFWYLDAHWFNVPGVAGKAEGLPLWDELEAIAARPWADVVVVDDVHAFGTDRPTPEWLEVSLERIAAHFPGCREAVIEGDQAAVYTSAKAA